MNSHFVVVAVQILCWQAEKTNDYGKPYGIIIMDRENGILKKNDKSFEQNRKKVFDI